MELQVTASNNVKLSIAPLKPSAIPSEESIIEAAEGLLGSIPSWKRGKTYHKTVKTFYRRKMPEDVAPWHCRVSEHPPEDATFNQLWAKLGRDKAVNEKEFIPEIQKATLVKAISPTQSIWTMYYTFTPPISPRVFTVLQVVHLKELPLRTGIVVSIPIDLTSPGDEALAILEEKGVKGRYVSVERIMELQNGNIEWCMATSSTPGGSIPNFIAESTMSGKIAADVPHFIKWLHSLREIHAT